MSEKKPLISVVITNYNYGKYLREATKSAINQTYKNTEIILIDDASSDDSRKVYEEFSEKVRVIEHKKNEGIVFSRNEALSEIKGEFLCFLDADNYLDEDYLEKLFAKMEREKLDVVYTDLERFGDETGPTNLPEFSVGEIISRNIVDMGALICVAAIGEQKFDDELNRLSHEDWDFFLGLALAGKKFAKSGETKLNYRVHKNHRNEQEDFAKNFLNIVKVNSYIIEKYRRFYPEKVNFTKKNELVTNYMSVIQDGEKKSEIIREKDEKIGQLEDDLAHIRSEIDSEIKQKEELRKEIEIIRDSRTFKFTKKLSGGLKNVIKLGGRK